MKFPLLVVFWIAVAFADDNEVLKDFAAENVEFVGKLYKELLKYHPENFLVCPLSMQTVFALVNEGARGNTAKEITNGLHLPQQDKVKETFLRLSESFQTNDKYNLSSANKIYLADYFKISDTYKNAAVDIFRSEIENVDFGNSHKAVADINKWVEERTHDKIKDLLSESMVGPDTVAVLINALYFQGKWAKQFGDTLKERFYINKEEVVYTTMMAVSDDFNYYESTELKAKFVELPYEGNEVTMNIVVPNEIEGLSVLEDRIADVLVAPKYSMARTNVYLPKFKIETTTEFIPVLNALGITDAFTSAADFSGIGENQEPLVISEVIQKAFIEVDQKGTTAAAASAVVFSRTGRFNEFYFYADRPFLFYLKHRVNGVLFIGRYSVPEKVDLDI